MPNCFCLLSSRVSKKLNELFLSVFLARSDGEVNAKGDGTRLFKLVCIIITCMFERFS